MSETGILHLQGVTVSLGGRALIAGLELAVAAGEIVTVMGPSGCGKSTLLAWLCGGVAPAFRVTGRALLNGAEITALPPETRHIGILFQDDLLFPHLSVGENLAFGIPPGIDRAGRAARIAAALVEAELPGFADRDPGTLSAGQRARVALMRTLLSEPKALLLDEPFGKLDAGLRGRIRRFVFDHAAERRLPVLLVTHDPDDAAAAGGRVIEIGVAAGEDNGC